MHTVTVRVRPEYQAEYGVTVTVAPVQALALARKGIVNLSKPGYETRELASSTPEMPEQPRRKRRYRRRDLTAEA
jgi:hypothetical protein